ARGSNSSIGSSSRPRKSFTGDSQFTQSTYTEPSNVSQQPLAGQLSQESSEGPRDPNVETERKGFLGKWKAKMSQAREERQAEKERAKSPPRSEQGVPRSSLSALAQEHLAPRGKSFDRPREDTLTERPFGENPGRRVSMDPGRPDRPSG